jgi:hypothetical protein
MLASKAQGVPESMSFRFLVYGDWQRIEKAKPRHGVGLGRAFSALSNDQRVRDFKMPQFRNNRLSRGKGIKNSLGIRVALVRKSPGDVD